LWLLDTILPKLNATTGVMITSESPECISRALFHLKGRPNTIVSAVTNDPARINAVAAQAAQHQAGLVAVLDYTKPLADAETIHFALAPFGIPDERLHLDPQVLPLAHQTSMPLQLLQTLPDLRRRFPRAHLLAGASNVSFNLPRRSLLNRTYLAML